MKPAGKALTSSLHEGDTSVRGAWLKHQKEDPTERAGTQRKFAPRAFRVASSAPGAGLVQAGDRA